MMDEIGATEGWTRVNLALAANMLREAGALTTQVGGEVIPSDKPDCMPPPKTSVGERPLLTVGSTGGRNTLGEYFSRCLEKQCFAWPLIKLAGHCAQLGLAEEG